MSNEKEKKIDELELYTDGASRGNPGPAGIGIVAVKDNKILYEEKEYLGKQTNNEAEYKAIIKALVLGEKYRSKRLKITSDSELVIKQLKGEYQLEASNLKPYYRKIKKKEEKFEEISYQHKRRTNKYIERADELANRALNIHQSKK